LKSTETLDLVNDHEIVRRFQQFRLVEEH